VSKVYIFQITQWIEVEADSRDEAVALIPLPQNGFEGESYNIIEEEITLQSEKVSER
jgi:hypothetical protein